jgi:hypothetical protein
MKRRLAGGSGTWARARRVVLTDNVESDRLADMVVVRTPLDLIRLLETNVHSVSGVVISGTYATTRWLRELLESSYPALIIDATSDTATFDTRPVVDEVAR